MQCNKNHPMQTILSFALILVFSDGSAAGDWKTDICPSIAENWTYQTLESHNVSLEGGEYGVYFDNGIVVASQALYYRETGRTREITFFDRDNGDCVAATDIGYNLSIGYDDAGEALTVASNVTLQFRFRPCVPEPKIMGYAGPSPETINRAKNSLQEGYRIRSLLD